MLRCGGAAVNGCVTTFSLDRQNPQAPPCLGLPSAARGIRPGAARSPQLRRVTASYSEIPPLATIGPVGAACGTPLDGSRVMARVAPATSLASNSDGTETE
jgi:hypothetical protein